MPSSEPTAAIGNPPTDAANWNHRAQCPPDRKNDISHQTQDRESRPKDFPLHVPSLRQSSARCYGEAYSKRFAHGHGRESWLEPWKVPMTFRFSRPNVQRLKEALMHPGPPQEDVQPSACDRDHRNRPAWAGVQFCGMGKVNTRAPYRRRSSAAVRWYTWVWRRPRESAY